MRAALLLVTIVLGGCLGGSEPECRPRTVASWDDVRTFDALGAAGIEADEPEPGLPYHAPDLDATWRGYSLRSVSWDPDLNDEGKRERDADAASLRQLRPGSDRVAIGLSVSALKDEAATRARFDGLVRNVTTADERTLDELFERMLETRYESGIMYPDSPTERRVTTYGYRGEADLPLRLSELDAELAAADVPRNEHAGYGHASRVFPRYGFAFDVPTRETEVDVDGNPVVIETDGAGWGLAMAIGITDPADGAGTVLAAFETLRVLPPAIESSRVRVATGCGP